MIDVGVTIKKNTKPNKTGETIFPKNIPILNHILFKGVKIFDFINPKIKKIKEIITDQILIGFSYVKGHKPTIKKTMKKIKPKFLFELIFILDFRSIINFNIFIMIFR